MRLRPFGASAIFVGLVACGSESFQVAADSGADRAEPVDAASGDAGGRFCDRVDVASLGMAGAIETFCADFDAPGQTSAASGWSSQVVANGTGLLDTETWRSPPAAFSSVTLGSDASTGGGNSYLVKALTKQASEIVYAFDFMATPDGDFVQVATVSFDAAAGLYLLALKMTPTGISLTEFRPAADGGAALIKDHLLSRKPEGTWIRVSIHATVGAAPSCTVTFDGEVVLEQQLVVGGAASPTLTLGALGVVPARPHTYRFDNVVAATR